MSRRSETCRGLNHSPPATPRQSHQIPWRIRTGGTPRSEPCVRGQLSSREATGTTCLDNSLSTQPNTWMVMGFSPSGDCRATIPGSPTAKGSQPAWFTPTAPGHNGAHGSSGCHARQQCRNQEPSCLVARQQATEMPHLLFLQVQRRWFEGLVPIIASLPTEPAQELLVATEPLNRPLLTMAPCSSAAAWVANSMAPPAQPQPPNASHRTQALLPARPRRAEPRCHPRLFSALAKYGF